MFVAKLTAALVAGAFAFAAVPSSAMAASPVTAAFVANLVPNIDFLDKSSRLALDTAKRAPVRAFARAEAVQQTAAAASVDEWVRAERAAQAVIAQMAAEGAPLQTGRSVAIDAPPPIDPAILHEDTRRPMGASDLARLQGLKGTAFEAAYRSAQLEALHQIAADYAAYIAGGDDPLLVGIAGRELPKVRQRIAELRKI